MYFNSGDIVNRYKLRNFDRLNKFSDNKKGYKIMEFRKLEAPSLKELFINELENMIISGKLQIGERLPSERELATSMQVSRAVVNSGIAEMEKKGFLIVKPRIGTFVEDYRRNGTLETLVSVMNYNGGMMQTRDIRSLLEVRIIFMTLASRLAIAHATDEELLSLKPYIEKLGQCTTAEAAACAVFQFSHELAFISDNTLLPLFFISFKELVCSLWERYCHNYGIPQLYQNTATIYEYLVKRDTEGVVEFIKISTEETIDGDRTIYKSK